MTKANKKELSLEKFEELLTVLKARFKKNINRHKALDWTAIQEKLAEKTFGRLMKWKILLVNLMLLAMKKNW